jgi:hypothetical protein
VQNGRGVSAEWGVSADNDRQKSVAARGDLVGNDGTWSFEPIGMDTHCANYCTWSLLTALIITAREAFSLG